MAVINGNDFVVTGALTSSGTQQTFLHANTSTIDHTDAVIEATTKDSDSTAEYISGRKTYTISVDGLLDYSGTGTSPQSQTFSGNGTLTAFTLTNTPLTGTITVTVGGVATTAFTVAGSVITFSSAPAAGTDNIVVAYSSNLVGLDTVELFDVAQAGSTIFWAASGDDRTGTGRVTYSGQALITSYSQSGGSDEVASYSMSLQGTGVITKATA